jgi:hypothetical protein
MWSFFAGRGSYPHALTISIYHSLPPKPLFPPLASPVVHKI